MIDKVYITSEQMATFVCPKCRKSKTVNVSQYPNLDKIIKVNIKCPCGYAYAAILEKRKKYRKSTNLPGSYTRFVHGNKAGGGLMMVRDLSTTGIKIQTNGNHGCVAGDIIKVEFHLDDARRSLITKKVIVCNISGNEIGAKFAPTEAIGKALGFYLFS